MGSIDSPVFPSELERRIFETAAELHLSLIPTLLRVAPRVQVWIEPLLYRTLMFTDWRSPPALPSLLRAMSLKPAAFIHTTVRNVIFWDNEPYEEAPSSENFDGLLSVCTSIQNLALWGLVPLMFAALSTLHELRRLTLPFTAFHDPRMPSLLAHPIFCTISHLTIHDYRQDHYTYAGLSTFDVELITLTHLPAFVIGFMSREYFQNWTIEAAGGHDFWTRAEEFLAARQTGEGFALIRSCDPAQRLWYRKEDGHQYIFHRPRPEGRGESETEPSGGRHADTGAIGASAVGLNQAKLSTRRKSSRTISSSSSFDSRPSLQLCPQEIGRVAATRPRYGDSSIARHGRARVSIHSPQIFSTPASAAPVHNAGTSVAKVGMEKMRVKGICVVEIK
ncbi:hypothetical protein FB451DRAFT_1166749 [Mycena latifolia]|nr:hypothetical protein FB451DRAFT_1166749 [Mycena latifolia]